MAVAAADLPRKRRLLATLGAGAVIAAFFVSLVLTCIHLLRLERQLTPHPGESVVWLASQAQYEAMRTLDMVVRRVAGDPEADEAAVQLRYDVLLSRMAVLREGRPLLRVQQTGLEETMEQQLAAVAGLEPAMLSLQPEERAAEAMIRAALHAAAGFLRELANRVLLEDQQNANTLRQARGQAVAEILFYVVGVLASGMLLMLVLVRQRKAQIRAEASLEREREVSRLHRAFVSMVSHQFRTPLAIIDSSAQRMIRRGTAMPPEEVFSRAGKIREATRRLTRLMESTLNAARLEAGEINMAPRETDLAALVREVCGHQQEIAPAALLEQRLDGLPARLRCDPTLVEQAVANLVSNAVKYSPPGSPVVLRGLTGPGGSAVLEVVDQGVGIPADELPRIFDRFFRARTAEGVTGTGIGLAFVRHVARLHGGEVTVTSEEGKGSTFVLRLPPAPPPAGGAQAGAKEAALA
ncbi:sensor histidine kinase [Pararoseomonas baculiformis]|nr:HAMP domain-containing sensor histidine kinase [Pararoseomonas baculiformis]